MITPTSVPGFPRGVKYRHDAARGLWVLLTPERALMPDDNAQAVLSGIDGTRTVADIVNDLASRYQAPAEVILADVLELLSDLAARGVIIDRGEGA